MDSCKCPWPGGKYFVLLEENLAYDVGVIGSDGVNATKANVNQWSIFITQRSKISVRQLAQLKKVAKYGPSGWAWRKPFDLMQSPSAEAALYDDCDG